MANILSVGAGAASGLDSFLRQMADERDFEEQVRARKAQESLGARGLDIRQQESAADRDLRAQQQLAAILNQISMQDDRAARLKAGERDDLRSALDDLMPGVSITPETRNRAVETGAATPERFVSQFIPEDFVGPIQEGEPQRGELAGYTLSGKPPKEDTPVSYQRDTFLINGKPEDVFINPRTREMHLVRTGEAVPPGSAQHYERPREAPVVSYSPIQSGEGYIRFNRRTGQFEGDSGQVIPNPELATSGSTRTMQEGAKMLQPHVPELDQLAAALDKRGLFGPVMSRIRDLAVRFGTTGDPGEVERNAQALSEAILSDPQLNQDELAGQFATSLGLMTSGMGRVHGGARGGGSIQMINYLKTLLSGSSTYPMFRGRLRAIDSYLKGYASGPVGEGQAPESPAPTAGGDAYQRYLDRTRK